MRNFECLARTRVQSNDTMSELLTFAYQSINRVHSYICACFIHALRHEIAHDICYFYVFLVTIVFVFFFFLRRIFLQMCGASKNRVRSWHFYFCIFLLVVNFFVICYLSKQVFYNREYRAFKSPTPPYANHL